MQKALLLSLITASSLLASNFNSVSATDYKLSIQGDLSGHMMFYMDSDNNKNTGYSFGAIKGADYKVELEDVSTHRTGSSWLNRVYHYEGNSERVWENWSEKSASSFLFDVSVASNKVNFTLNQSALGLHDSSHYSIQMLDKNDWSSVQANHVDKSFSAGNVQTPSTDTLTLPKGGFSKLQLYINSDNNDNTGLSFSSVKGADFMIELTSLDTLTGNRAWENRLYKYKGGSSWDVWDNIKENALDSATLVKVDNTNITLNIKAILAGETNLDNATSYIVKRDSGWDVLSITKTGKSNTPPKDDTPPASGSTTLTINKDGFDKLQLYIDSDNNTNTGESFTHAKGADYMIEMTDLSLLTGNRSWASRLYKWQNGSWSKVKGDVLDSSIMIDITNSQITLNLTNILKDYTSAENISYSMVKRDGAWRVTSSSQGKTGKGNTPPKDDTPPASGSTTLTINKDGFSKLQLYIDSDNNTNTGESFTHAKGADYMIEMTDLYLLTGNRSWANRLYRRESKSWSKVKEDVLDNSIMIDVKSNEIVLKLQNILKGYTSAENIRYSIVKRDGAWRVTDAMTGNTGKESVEKPKPNKPNQGKALTKAELKALINAYDNNPRQANKEAIENANVSAITDMSGMFFGTGSFGSPFNLDLSRWDTSKVTNMKWMFHDSKIPTLPESFDTSNVTNMSMMFTNSEITSLPESFDTSKVTDMSWMFYRSVITSLPESFDTSKVTDMSMMFNGSKITTLPESFDTSKVTNMARMFSDSKITVLPKRFDTSKVTDMSWMFFKSEITSLPESFDTSKVTDMGGMFTDSKITSLPKRFDTSKVTDMSGMFNNSQITTLPESFDTSRVTNMRGMFTNSKITSLPESFDTSKVTDMYGMFHDSPITVLPKSFDTSRVTNMGWMFRNSKIASLPESFDTSKVTNMSGIFWDSEITSLPKSFDTSNMTKMSYMFENSKIASLPESFDTSNATDMSYMFTNSKITSLPESFDTSKVRDMSGMFSTSKITSVPESFDTSNATDMYAMFYGTKNFNQDISRWDVSKVPVWNNNDFNKNSNLQTSHIPAKFR